MSEAWIFSRDRRRATGERSDRASRLVLVLAFLVGLGGAFWWGQQRRLGSMAFPVDALMAASIVLIWAGAALRLWAVRTLGRCFRTAVMVLDDHRLVETGPYRRLRHPSYAGTLITLLGVAFGIGNWISLVALSACVLPAYAWRIRVEEAALLRRFGPVYEDYRRTRSALIPGVW